MCSRNPATTRRLLLAGVLLFAHPAAAGDDGSIRCRGADSAGRRVDGTCTASGPGVRSCTTAAGTCTIVVPPGTYTVTLRTRSGRTSPPRTAHVPAGSMTTVVLVVDPDPEVAFEPEGRDLTVQAMPTGTADAGTRPAAADAGTADAGMRSAAVPGADAGAAPPAGSGGAATVVTGADAGAVVPADGATEVATSVRAFSGPTFVRAPVDPPDRSTGTTLAVQGRVADARGRAVDGTVTVFQDGRPIGRAVTTAGRFRLYDLPAGALTLSFRSASGAAAAAETRYSGTPVTVVLSVRAP